MLRGAGIVRGTPTPLMDLARIVVADLGIMTVGTAYLGAHGDRTVRISRGIVRCRQVSAAIHMAQHIADALACEDTVAWCDLMTCSDARSWLTAPVLDQTAAGL